MRIGPKAAASLGFEPVSVWDTFYTYARVWNMYVQYILTKYVLCRICTDTYTCMGMQILYMSLHFCLALFSVLILDENIHQIPKVDQI